MPFQLIMYCFLLTVLFIWIKFTNPLSYFINLFHLAKPLNYSIVPENIKIRGFLKMLLWEYNFIMNTIIRSLNMANNTMLKLIKLIFRLHFPIFKWFLDSEGEISVFAQILLAFYSIFFWKRPLLTFYLSYQNGGKILSLEKTLWIKKHLAQLQSIK